jgi:hypothetical protein
VGLHCSSHLHEWFCCRHTRGSWAFNSQVKGKTVMEDSVGFCVPISTLTMEVMAVTWVIAWLETQAFSDICFLSDRRDARCELDKRVKVTVIDDERVNITFTRLSSPHPVSLLSRSIFWTSQSAYPPVAPASSPIFSKNRMTHTSTFCTLPLTPDPTATRVRF